MTDYDRIYQYLHSQNEAAHAQGRADRRSGWTVSPRTYAANRDDVGYWYREGFAGRAFQPLTGAKDYVRIASEWYDDEKNEGAV